MNICNIDGWNERCIMFLWCQYDTQHYSNYLLVYFCWASCGKTPRWHSESLYVLPLQLRTSRSSLLTWVPKWTVEWFAANTCCLGRQCLQLVEHIFFQLCKKGSWSQEKFIHVRLLFGRNRSDTHWLVGLWGDYKWIFFSCQTKKDNSTYLFSLIYLI